MTIFLFGMTISLFGMTSFGVWNDNLRIEEPQTIADAQGEKILYFKLREIAKLTEKKFMDSEQVYSIGTLGKKWGQEEKTTWLGQQEVKRSYQLEVVDKIEALKSDLDVSTYGELHYGPGSYPLFIIKTRNWDADRKTILITGGVHGYETSGVQGAIRFLQTKAEAYSVQFNIVVAPCVSPWGYATINRWNPDAIDPNRSFYADSPAQECALLMTQLDSLNVKFDAHFDLHETTDTDNTEFRPALAARDAVEHDNWFIPDGFYLVGDSARPADDFQKAIIGSVEQVTHVAPADEQGRLIGELLEQWGVVNYAARSSGLCMGMTDSEFVTTTEVYPDSPKVDGENCIVAQVAAVCGGLDYIAAKV